MSSYIKDFRLRLGMTQLDLAMYLKVVTSVVSMAESGFRELPEEAFKKLLRLEGHYRKATENKQAGEISGAVSKLEPHHQRAIKRINRRVEVSKTSLPVLQNKLASMMENYERLSTAFDALTELESGLQASEDARYELQWLEAQQNRLIMGMEKCSPAMQAALRIKIGLLEAEISMSNRILHEFSGTNAPGSPENDLHQGFNIEIP